MHEREITIRVPAQNEHLKFSIPNFMTFGNVNLSLEILIYNKYSGSFNFNFTATPLEFLPFEAKILIHFKSEFVDIDKKLKFDQFNPSRSIVFTISSYMMKEMESYVNNDISIQIEPTFQTYDINRSSGILNANSQNDQSKINNIYQIQNDQNYKKSKFNGLYNQGATCYINSAIQSMFHIPFFRQIVYKIRVSKDNDQERSIITELQSLFNDLEHGKSTCSTRKLTNALGMNNKAVHVQQDIQEFVHFFTDIIDKIIDKNDEELKGKISYIFGGKTIQTIRNKNGEILSSNEEDFNELIIDIGNSVDESLMSYIKEETIDDYKDDKTGLVQTVTIQTKILKLPRILQLLIKRYKYDPLSDQNVKDNSKMTFKNELDLSLFVFKNDPNISANYTLFAVIVHEGSLSCGHYFVYLKPEMKDKWFFFSDSNVHQATAQQAIEDNFGCNNHFGKYNENYEWSTLRSAYILIYVRNDAINEMFSINESEVHHDDANEEKIERKDEVEEQKEENQITDNLIEFSIFNELCLIDNCEKGKPFLANDSFCIEISVDLRSKGIELYEKVSEKIKLNVNCIRLWTISKDYRRLKRIVDQSEFINQLRVQSLFLEIKAESEELFESEYIRKYFLILYTQISSKPFLFLRSRRYSLIERSSDLNGFGILKYATIIEDATEILNSIFESNLSGSDLNIYLANSKKALLQSPMSNCTEENGAIMIIRIDDRLISFNENLVNEIERKIGLKEKLKFIIENSVKGKKELTEIPIYKYFDFVQVDYSNLPDEFIEKRHNLKRAKVYDFNNISKIVGIIEIPINIEYQELVNFVRIAFNMNQLDYEKESLLLFGRDEDRKNFDFPRKKPLFESRFPFMDENLDTIYYCITPKQFAIDPSSETRIVQLSNDGHSVSKNAAYFIPKSVIHPFYQFYKLNESLFVDDENAHIRMFIVNKNNEFGLPIDDESNVVFDNENILRIEKVSDDQIGKELVLIYKAKVDKFRRIHEFGDPFYFAYIENEPLTFFQSRIWKFLGNQEKFKVYMKRPYYQDNYVMNDFIHADNQKILYLIYENN